MISYETYLDSPFSLGSGVIGTNFIRSQFDYGIRQRRAVRGYDTFSAKLVCGEDEMDAWIPFWDALNDGNDKFYTNMAINGDLSTAKIVRFTSGYTVSQIGGGRFIITVPLELIETGA